MIGFIRNKSLPARRYLVLLVLPWCLMLLLTVAVLWPYLVGFRTTVKTLQDVQLPGILEAQRTRANLNMLRKQLAIIYLAEAPLERRRARLHAQALLAGMAHDPSPVATEVLALGPRIRQLYMICMEADKGLSRLHRHEMEMMLALNSLEQATGRKMAGEVIFSHTGRDGVRHDRMAFEKMQRLMAPVEQMCAGSEEFRDICDLFGKHKRALGEAWREKLAIDAQARALWQSLEDELLRLVNEVSSRELQRSLEEAESLSEATDYIVWSIFLFTLGLLAFLLVLLLLLRRDLLRPLVRIAGNLSRLRDGMQPEPIPAVRITELQEVVDIVPDIGGYLGSLRERSCRLEEEKDAYSRMSLMDSLTGIPNRRALDMRLADLAELRQLLRHPKVVAIGEIGLDYYWLKTPEERANSRDFFDAQLSLAEELNLPAIVHDRDAHRDCLDIVRAHPGVRGVFHCYSGSLEDAKVLVKLGWMLSFTGVITYKNARKALEVIEWLPMDRIMVETDSPYLTPEPFRGKRNDSGKVHLVAEAIARVKGMDPEEAARITLENGTRFFRIEI